MSLVHTNRLLDIDVPVKHSNCAAPQLSFPGKCLTFRPLNGVTSYPCHALFSCQFSATPFLKLGQAWDRQTDNGHQCIMPHGLICADVPLSNYSLTHSHTAMTRSASQDRNNRYSNTNVHIHGTQAWHRTQHNKAANNLQLDYSTS